MFSSGLEKTLWLLTLNIPPTPLPELDTPLWPCVLGFFHRHLPPQSTTPGSLKLWLIFFFFAWIHSVFAWTQLFLLSSKSSQLPAFILSKLFIGSWRVQVRFAASGSTGRMSPLKQWSWTSPLVRASSGPRTSWTVSCRRSTPSPSKHMIVERVLMVPTWRSLTSESCHCHLTSPHSFEVEGFLVMKPVDSWL